MYWKNNNHGYTADVKQAKIFSEDEAREITDKYNTTKRMIKYEVG